MSSEGLDQLKSSAKQDGLHLTWSDVEDSVQGSLRPAALRAGDTVHLVVSVGSFEGKPFEGPVTLTLRHAPGEDDGPAVVGSVTVKPEGTLWKADFTPPSSGVYLLDVGFKTSRTKVVHTSFDVGSPRIPVQFGIGLMTVLVLGAVALWGRRFLPQRPAPPPTEG